MPAPHWLSRLFKAFRVATGLGLTLIRDIRVGRTVCCIRRISSRESAYEQECIATGVPRSLVTCTGALVLVLGPSSCCGPLSLATAQPSLGGHSTVVLCRTCRSSTLCAARSLSIELGARTFLRCSSRSCSGTFSSRVSILALAFTGAESIAWVWPAHHPLFHAHGQHLGEHFLENGFGEQLPRTAYGTVPRQLLVQVVAYEIKDIKAHRTMADELAVADDVLKIPHQTELEEHHRVYTFPAAFPVISLGQRIEEIQVDGLLQPPVEILLRYSFAKLETREQLFLITLFSLHT